MKRNEAREIAVQLLFALKYNNLDLDSFISKDNFSTLLDEYNDLFSANIDSKSVEYIKSLIQKYSDNEKNIIDIISQNANNWDVNRLSGTALACLKCAITEMFYFDDIPISATINSIIDIAKKYDDQKTVSFINGVLGAISKTISTNE